MSPASPVVYSVPTHLQEREPFAFGRTVGEVAKLVVIGFAAARLIGSENLAPGLRLPAAAALLVAGAGWALVRIQRRPVEAWLGLAFRYGATPRRRVWRPGPNTAADQGPGDQERAQGWCDLERVRVRWADPDARGGHEVPGASALPAGGRSVA